MGIRPEAGLNGGATAGRTAGARMLGAERGRENGRSTMPPGFAEAPPAALMPLRPVQPVAGRPRVQMGRAPRIAPAKRATDILVVLLLAPLALPLAVLLAGLIRLLDGAPVLHVAERMNAPDRSFLLYKFRSLRPGSRGVGALGGDRAGAVTPLGRMLRRSRLDELPQLWNILRGDMSFVGPRPPEPIYVARRPDLYARVLASPPGLTGLATLAFHAREERLLAACTTAEETDAVYMRRCLPRKARLDLLWQARATPARDLGLLALTFARVLRLPTPKRALHRRR